MIKKTYMVLGHKCNANCSYCSQHNFGGRYKSKDLDINYDALSLFTDYINKTTPKKTKLVFFGGEPLVYLDKLYKLVEFFESKSDKFEFSVITNGKNLTKDVAEYFNNHDFSVTLSYDGFNQKRLRGFDPLEQNLDAWLSLKHRSFSSVISAETPDMREMWKFIDEFNLKYNTDDKVHFEIIKSINNDVPKNFLLDESNGSVFEKSLDDVFNIILNDILNNNLDTHAYRFALPYLRSINFRMKFADPFPSCAINRFTTQLDVSGNIYECHSVQRIKGTLLKDGVLKGHRGNFIDTFCSGCDLISYCGGGCTVMSESTKHLECYMNKQIYGRFKKLLEILLKYSEESTSVNTYNN